MDILLSILGFLTVFGVCLYHRMSLFSALVALTVTMVVLTLLDYTGVIGWLLYLAAIALLAVPSIRQSVISEKALTLFKKVLPAMSQTEKEALDAGTVWWEAELFKGKPNWNITADPTAEGKHIASSSSYQFKPLHHTENVASGNIPQSSS